jgi:polyisoprenoid-binding protein YceI
VIPPGTHRLGPANSTLWVRTKRGGAAAKAGHDLDLEVTAWEATLDIGERSSAELTADAGSLRVRRASGGVQALGDDDKAKIHRTIDDDVLKRRDIVFRATRVESSGDGLDIEGDLTLAGTTQPITFALAAGEDGTLSGSALLTQTRWGVKPYSALWGALKVLDEVEVALEGHL